VALVRVYCGVAAAEMPSWLTVAIVDDAGRLLDVRHLCDDPAGYAALGLLLADKSGGSAPVAADRSDHLVVQLLCAASRPIAVPDPAAVAHFTEHFCDEGSYEEMRAPTSQRRAVGLARALQAGALSATAMSVGWEYDEFKPVLAAHAAVTAGRQAAAAALREVLRELYPAALRAYPDPAEPVHLKILESLPEPGMVTTSPSSKQRESALVAELASMGVTDTTTAVSAITALRVAVDESPRWSTNRALGPVVAETVRQAVAAVRACDAASAALIATLVERLGAGAAPPSRPYLVPQAPSSPISPATAPRRFPGPAAEVPPSRLAPRANAASAAAAGTSAYGGPNVPWQAGPGEPGWDSAPAAQGWDAPAAYGQTPAAYSAPNYPPAPDMPPSYGGPPAGTYSGMPPAPSYGNAPPPYGYADESETTLAFSSDPLRAPLPSAPPPGLRLVEPPPRNPMVDTGNPLVDPLPPASEPPILRVIDGERNSRPTKPADDDLLIFSDTRSAWFTPPVDDTVIDEAVQNWSQAADEGWRAAEQLAHPAVGAATTAGLPRRVPQANLVPGTAQGPRRQLRIVRDARSIADHTEGYFRGWRRGQEIGGFAVGQRDRAAWEFNRDQRAREGTELRARLS
jgi:hypothetical protein